MLVSQSFRLMWTFHICLILSCQFLSTQGFQSKSFFKFETPFLFSDKAQNSIPTARNHAFPRKPSTYLSASSFNNFVNSANRFAALKNGASATNAAVQFIENCNDNLITEAMELIDAEVEYFDTSFSGPFTKAQLERTLRLTSQKIPSRRERIIVEEIASSSNKIGIFFHTESADGKFLKKGAASFILNPSNGLIQNVFYIKENSKGGDANLKVLRAATKVSEIFQDDSKPTSPLSTPTSSSDKQIQTKEEGKLNPINFFFPQPTQSIESSLTPPEQYFAAWNERDMTKACDVFTNDCEYDDTAFPSPFVGKEDLEKHLMVCADCFPSSFGFSIDDQIVDKNGNILVRWHVESNGKELYFTRGCSFYNVRNGKIVKGTDFVEPPVFKTGGASLFLESLISKLSEEPIRFIPLLTWAAYMYVVFFSDWFYGLPATSLEQRTWEEVRDLSLNFFLVSPVLHLPFAPVIHPMLEGVFNLLLSWAALFAGFLSDDRPKKPNPLPMLPMVAGMQFLTSAFLLPYLVTRTNEKDENGGEPNFEDLTQAAKIAESRWLAPFLTVVGSGSVGWGILARADDYGGWNERLSSFVELLRIDRVGSSFLVDLAIFAAFQGWFVDDDAKRRGMEFSTPLVIAAKFVPFVGMAAYLTFRDPILSRDKA